MDDTQQSRVSDASAAATRKRRSSILKSQRPARTPFSELEFNVATPTDTAKSRRVSFSRRTGVAEFVTNEATTTWKNFYEEHNKSLESSNNDSEANASRQPVGHLGKRIFDQQFEEVEAVDFISGLANASLNNVNFSQQLASLETTGDGKLTAPHNKFELSAFTEPSKLFSNDLTAPSIGENSGRIDINFSAIQQEKDDLDEIEKDLERGSNSMGCHDPFGGRQNVSEYIEVDLNMTHVVKNDEDMSITDTVHSPVQDVSRSASIDKKVSLNSDWVVDKENIAINPYATPSESNFASDEPDQVLVFDGKRLTLQPDKPAKDKNYRQTLLPNSSADTPQRKTIILNVNDDLPNFIDDMLNSKCENAFSGFQEIKMNDDDDISDTFSMQSVDFKPKRRTIHDNTGNISMTCALPTNIICHSAVISQDNHMKRRPSVFNESTSNISMTETVPVKLLCNSAPLPERRRTIVYEDDSGNISITQAVPSNILTSESSESSKAHKTMVFDTEEDDISVTQAVPSNILDDKANKRNTIVFDEDACNVSITQALPANIMLPETQEKRRTKIYENNTGNISITQSLPTNFIISSKEPTAENTRTVIYEDGTGNISVTQSLQSNVLVANHDLGDFGDINADDNDHSSKPSNTSSRRTIVYDEDDTGNLSITQAIPTQLIAEQSIDKALAPIEAFARNRRYNKRTTIVYDNDTADVSMTEVVSAAIIDEANKVKTNEDDVEDALISVNLAVSTNVFLLDKLDSTESIEKPKEVQEVSEKEEHLPNPTIDAEGDQKSTVFDADDFDNDMSMTMALPKTLNLVQEAVKRRTVIFDNDNCDISMTKPIPSEMLTFASEIKNKSKNIQLDLKEQDQGANPCSDVIVLQASTTNSMPSLAPTPAEQGDLKSTRDIYRNMISESKVTSCINVIEDEVSIPPEEDASGTHPKVELKIKQLNLVSSNSAMDEDEKASLVDEDAVTQTANKESLLNTLDMSVTTVNSCTTDKNIMAQIKSENSSVIENKDFNTSETMFYIMKDSDVVTQTEKDLEEARNAQPTIQQIEYKVENVEQVDDLQRKLAELEAENNTNRFYETIVSPDLEDVVERDVNVKIKEQGQSIMKANDTKELLEMISNFTDIKDSDEKKDSEHSDEDAEPAVVTVKVQGHPDNKGDIEPRRLSFAPKRQSIALSREDLLTNISMAQAALQKSRLALDDTYGLEEDTATDTSAKKSNLTSHEVVKTLQFEDESISETSLRSEEKYSPLKKTAFGETSYMTESSNAKGKVIPTYLKDVSDGIKELMLDLVKPMTDNLPFESALVDRGIVKNPSTQSTQIQANLVTSSQVDLDSDLFSNPESNTNIETISSLTSGNLMQRRSRSFRSPVKFSTGSSEQSSEFEVHSPKQRYYNPPAQVEQCQSEVLVFDHLNPLNNVLLGPLNYTDTHKYDPKKSDEALGATERGHAAEIHYVKNMRENECEMNSLGFPCRPRRRSHSTQGDLYGYKLEDQLSLHSSSSKPLSTDRSSGAALAEFMDCEVNTMIAMKGNKELLDASSSLTLVDDAMDIEKSQTTKDHDNEHQRLVFSRSHLNDIQEQVAEIDKLSEISLSDHHYPTVGSKGKKRIFSPSDKHKLPSHLPSVDVTPKPTSKMQKISNSPKIHRVSIDQLPPELTSMAAEKDVTETIENAAKTPEKKNSKVKVKKPGQSITVQQLITDYHSLECSFKKDKKILDTLNPKSESFMEFSQSDISFSSSNNLNAMKDVQSTSTTYCQSSQQSTQQSCQQSSQQLCQQSSEQSTVQGDQPQWHQELMCTTSSNLCDTESGINVVAKIDMLPFMGSHECEWESSAADTWSFRLLHGRLRLTARLAHRHDNATRTKVRGDTPVTEIAVETVQHDKKNPVATMCVRFACNTIRYMITRACRSPSFASDIPPFLRRCAAAARIALRWGRAMHDAKLHLAYTLDHDGNLSLKVANIPLRSVWEVTMRIELVLNDKRSMPWPRAADVRVSRVVSDVLVSDDDVRRVLAHTPRDWGHAPRTIWRMFRYLKQKTREDDLLS